MANPYRRALWSQHQHIHEVWHIYVFNKEIEGVKRVELNKWCYSLEAAEKQVAQWRKKYPKETHHVNVSETYNTTYSIP